MPIPNYHAYASDILFPIIDDAIRTECAPPTLLASLLQNTEEMMVLHNRLKLSGFERDMALFVIDHRNDADMKGNKEWQLCPRYRFFSNLFPNS